MSKKTTGENFQGKKLYISPNDYKISGVCGGIAAYFGIDSALVRLAWIVLTILTGVFPGIIGYIVAAVVIPKTPEGEVL